MSGRVRVLWVVKGLGAGGAERLLVSLARVADQQRFEYEVCYLLPGKNVFRPPLESAGVAAHCLNVHSSRDLTWPGRLRQLVRHGRYDVVHTHSPMVAAVVRPLVRTLPRGSRPVVVSTEHNSWDSYLWPTRVLNAALYRFDDHRFAVSRQAAASVWRPMRNGVEVLVHGIVPGDYGRRPDVRTAEREKLGLSDDDMVVTTVANLRREKGYPELLAAAQRILATNPSVTFLAAGQGAEARVLHADHSRRRLGDRFRFLGQVDDVAALLAASDVFVLASRFEGSPIAIMEAMSTGLPVVASRVGGIPDLITDGADGILVEPRDPHALARALELLCREPDVRERLGRAAEERAGAFDIETAMRRIEAVYTSLVTGGVGSPGKSGLTPPAP